MSRTIEEIGMIAGGLAMAFMAGPLGVEVFQNLVVCNMMIGVGLTTALAGTVGLLASTPQQPSSLSPQGQLPIQTPNPLWRIVYGLFQFGGTVTFADGPFDDWVGTVAEEPPENQYMQFVHTLCAHQIAGFVSVVLDGQTFNFGTDLVQLTSANQVVVNGIGQAIFCGPVGAWGFIDLCNPWCGVIWFEFDAGNPNSNGAWPYPFPSLLYGYEQLVGYGRYFVTGSPRWTSACLQQGRAKVHVGMHYEPYTNEPQGGQNGGPHPYVLGSGRVPTIEFKILGRIIRDFRIQTAWQASTVFAKYSYVIALGASGSFCVFVQTNSAGTSGATAPAFSGIAVGSTVSDGGCLWLNAGAPTYALGCNSFFTPTFLNNPASNKLQKNILMADAWGGGLSYGPLSEGGEVIEAPIGYLQYAGSSTFASGASEPAWATTVGGTTVDGSGTWTCLGRSMYATVLPDSDGTENEGGFSNPALVIADYLTTPRNQFGLGVPPPSGSFVQGGSLLLPIAKIYVGAGVLYIYTAATFSPALAAALTAAALAFSGATAATWINGQVLQVASATDWFIGSTSVGTFLTMATTPPGMPTNYGPAGDTGNAIFGFAQSINAPLSSDSIETIVAAANICDEPQAIEVFSDGTTLYERSYSCNGCFDSSSAYGDVLKALALSMAGYVVPPGDCWRVYAGSYQPPLLALSDADARGPIKAEIRLSARDSCNGVKGQYIPKFVPINPLGSLSSSPASAAWKKTDFPPVQRSQYIEEDGGVILWSDISLDFTLSLWMAQRIARIVLERTRRQITVSLPAKSTPLQLLAGDTVTFTHPRWEGVTPPMPTVFFVAHLGARTEDSDGSPAVGVDLVLRQTDANVYMFQGPSSPTNFGDYSPYGQTGIGAGNAE
jgi:hypothetical protein